MNKAVVLAAAGLVLAVPIVLVARHRPAERSGTAAPAPPAAGNGMTSGTWQGKPTAFRPIRYDDPRLILTAR